MNRSFTNTTAAQRTTAKAKRPHQVSEPPDSGEAFIPDVARTHARLVDDEAESFAEEFIASATSAEEVGEDARNEVTTEELGGPFLQMLMETEADDDDDDQDEAVVRDARRAPQFKTPHKQHPKAAAKKG